MVIDVDVDQYDPELDRYDVVASYYNFYDPDVPVDEELERLSAEAEGITPVEMAIWEVATQPLRVFPGGLVVQGPNHSFERVRSSALRVAREHTPADAPPISALAFTHLYAQANYEGSAGRV